MMIDATKIIGDEEAERIIAALRTRPLPDREVPRVCGIPVARAYKKMRMLEKLGILICVREAKDKFGRTVKFYKANVEDAYVCVDGGRTRIRLAVALDISDHLRNKWNSLNARIMNVP
ncbi:MAG: hypothetical protein DRN20_01525 [Thermoplasmata archaeon]|nr:MAG: hypothetical protein DRN20_01525 [Thermoplasmata archaeon]